MTQIYVIIQMSHKYHLNSGFYFIFLAFLFFTISGGTQGYLQALCLGMALAALKKNVCGDRNSSQHHLLIRQMPYSLYYTSSRIF